MQREQKNVRNVCSITILNSYTKLYHQCPVEKIIAQLWLFISLSFFLFSLFRRMDKSLFPVLMGRQMIRQNITVTQRRTHRLRVYALTICACTLCVYITLISLLPCVCVEWQWLTLIVGCLPASEVCVCVRLKMWSLSFYLCALVPQLILPIIPSYPRDENTYIEATVSGHQHRPLYYPY